jgi:hypothetical protein
MHSRTLLIEGCECRLQAFVQDLQEFANDWVKGEARKDARKELLDKARAKARGQDAPAALEEWPPRAAPCRGCPD